MNVWNFQPNGSRLILEWKSTPRSLPVSHDTASFLASSPHKGVVPRPVAVVGVRTNRYRVSSGYFTQGKKMTEEELKAVQGRMWEE
jgi:hypothetical protein